jgi:adenylate cyclase
VAWSGQNEQIAPTEHKHEEMWHQLLTGHLRSVRVMRKLLGWIPSEPRCKLCAAPFGRPGKTVLKFVGFGPSRLNRRLCRACFRSVEKKPGGAEVEISLLFADVRGSTALAEHTPVAEYSRLIAHFYGVGANVVDRWDGIVDKFVGDQIVALFIPGFAGDDHASKALSAARDLFAETGNDGDDPWVRLGAGIHTGVAYVGTVGEGDALDFTALGDPANTTARLASEAAAGEILVSAAAAEAAGFATEDLEARTLTLRGRSECVQAWVARVEAGAPVEA